MGWLNSLPMDFVMMKTTMLNAILMVEIVVLMWKHISVMIVIVTMVRTMLQLCLCTSVKVLAYFLTGDLTIAFSTNDETLSLLYDD